MDPTETQEQTIQTTRIYRENRDSGAFISLNRGGTRSSKTYSLVQLAFMWLISDWPGKVWSITRKTFPALRATGYRDFLEILDRAEMLDEIKHRKDPGNYTFEFNGKLVEFFSLDDEVKIRSRKRDILHIIESNEITHALFIQLMIRTKGKIFLDLNPSEIQENWCKLEIEEKRLKLKGDVDVIQSTYMDNRFLTTEERENIEYLKEIDDELWMVFGLGEWGKITGLVFPDYEIIDKFPEDIREHYLGLDFGYSIDPAAMVNVGRIGMNLYIDELLYDTKKTNGDLATFQKNNLINRITTVADSAEPKSIEEMNRAGCRVVPSRKGPDSVFQGIMQMKQFKIHITKRSVNIHKEFNNYKWSDKPDVPIDRFNHAIDSSRYVVQTRMSQGFSIKVAGIATAYKNYG